MLKNMGGEEPGFGNRNRAGGFDILEHCHSLGLGVVRLGAPNREAPMPCARVRKKLDTYGMRLHRQRRTARTDAALPRAYEPPRLPPARRELDAVTTQASFTARRYEEFDTFEAFKTSLEAAQEVLSSGPSQSCASHKMKLAIENHKGWRAAEHAAWVKQIGSEYVGVCYDFGNNIALCEDPAETYKLLAPLTFYVSFKDMAVAPYEDGFLLSEVALGEGILDIPGMVKGLQQRDPGMIFALEMITREPLKIPVFTKKYWATFDDGYSPLPGRDLARVLEIARSSQEAADDHGRPQPGAGAQTEDDLINRSIEYARKNLSL